MLHSVTIIYFRYTKFNKLSKGLETAILKCSHIHLIIFQFQTLKMQIQNINSRMELKITSTSPSQASTRTMLLTAWDTICIGWLWKTLTCLEWLLFDWAPLKVLRTSDNCFIYKKTRYFYIKYLIICNKKNYLPNSKVKIWASWIPSIWHVHCKRQPILFRCNNSRFRSVMALGTTKAEVLSLW